MTICLGKSCSFGLPRVPFINCFQFMYAVEIEVFDQIAQCLIKLHVQNFAFNLNVKKIYSVD